MNLLDRTRPAPYAISNGTDSRDPDAYLLVLKQFGFDTEARYQPGSGNTYCNIAMWDASRALACEVPHWWIRSDMTYGQQEETINASIDWLTSMGGDYGWLNAGSLSAAMLTAQAGQPTLVTWKNPSGHGHVAWLLPDGSLAQAGAKCGYGIPMSQVFTPAMMLELQFFAHA